MLRNILIAIFLVLLQSSCSKPGKTVPEPNYNPHILKPTRYVPTQGKKINMDSVARPKYYPAKGKYVKAGSPKFVPQKSKYLLAGKPKIVPVKKEVIDMNSVARPIFHPVTATKDQASWPNWNPVPVVFKGNSPFAYMDVEQGLYSPFVKCFVEDQYGRIWIGHHGGALGVWDGQNYAYYTPEQGLKLYSGIFCMMEDREGRLWLGGESLSIWDGKHFFNYNRDSIGGSVYKFFEDSARRIWMVSDRGLMLWNTINDQEGYFLYTDAEGLSSNHVNSIIEDQNGQIWIATSRGLNLWDGKQFTHFRTTEAWFENNMESLLLDRQGTIWIGTTQGISAWDGVQLIHYDIPGSSDGVKVRNLLQDQDGHIWFDYGDGIGNWDGHGFIKYTKAEGLSNNGPYPIFQDRAGHIWIGTDGGGANIAGWKSFEHYTSEEGLSDNFIRSILEDRHGRIWLGTYTAGVMVWDPEMDQGGFTSYSESEGLIGNIVHGLVEDDEGRIWMGTEKGVSVWDGEAFTNFSTSEGLSGNRIWSIFKDSRNRIWIGTNGSGVNVWDGEGFTHYTTTEGLGGNNFFCFLEDRKGRIWMGTYSGVSVWDGTGFTHFTTEDGLGDNRIWSLMEDRKGNIWIGTNGGGVNVWDGHGLYQYNESGGLTQDIGRSLTQDENGDIWIGTFRGLNQLSPSTNEQEWLFRQYYQSDGLTGISINATLQDKNKGLLLGTSKGLGRLDLNQVRKDTSHPSLFIRDVQPFFEFVDWRRLQDSLQDGVLAKSKKQQIDLSGIAYDSIQAFTNLPINPEFPHHLNDLTFHWSGSHSIAPHKLLYSYFLAGNDVAWSPPLPENQIRLQNLRPGDYTFKLRAVGINGRWSETEAYPFTIRPPWWASQAAYLAYILITLALVYSIYRFQLNRRLAEAEAHRLRELDTFKSTLYTNITHEFRTPLTVIMGMAYEIRGHERIKRMIQRNSRDLLQLVNQMLDLRKLEVGALQLNLVQADIIPFLKYLVESFHSTAEAKDIRLSFQSSVDSLIMDHDPERLRQLVTNLLANAIKFTPAGGEIIMTVDGQQKTVDGQRQTVDGNSLLIKVRDNGSGIPEEQLPFIFDRFYQTDNSVTRKAEGTGIGLALVKELVSAMEGSIAVESKVGKGTEFSVLLPVRQQAELIDTTIDQAQKVLKESWASENDPNTIFGSSDAPLALIVEDNKDVADYLKVCLQDNYQVIWAPNGREGLEKAQETIPDIIITDVMMPEMDGFELCQKLKTDERTSHIPIIMLTARATQEDRLQGLEKGADVYLMKPFDKAELEIRLRKLIELRQKLQAKYSQADLDTVQPGRKNDPELLFLKKLQMVILENISDENFKVEPDLCRAMTMSRPQLYRKLKALRGVSPSEYMRNIRMQQARKLLIHTELSVGEIAEQVGFRDPSYFTKVYIATFNEAPSSTHK